MKYFIPTFVLALVFNLSQGQEQSRLLLEAYQAKSREKLEHFFNNWAQETAPILPAEMDKLKDTVREVYLVFREFYDPLKIERISGSEWGNQIYSKVKYFVIQDKINVGFVDTLDKDALLQKEFARLSKKLHVSVDSVMKGYKSNRIMMRNFRFDWPEPDKYSTLYDFRPRVSFKNPKTIILTAKYDSILNKFLENSHYPLGTGGLMAPAAAMGESANRQEFLENCIKIWYGHWGGYWQLYSYPYINSITFDKTLQYALVNFTLIYEGGFAYFKKINGAWALIEAERTWIE